MVMTLDFVPQNAEKTEWGMNFSKPGPYEEFMRAREQASRMAWEQKAKARADRIWLWKFGSIVTVVILVIWAFGASI